MNSKTELSLLLIVCARYMLLRPSFSVSVAKRPVMQQDSTLESLYHALLCYSKLFLQHTLIDI